MITFSVSLVHCGCHLMWALGELENATLTASSVLLNARIKVDATAPKLSKLGFLLFRDALTFWHMYLQHHMRPKGKLLQSSLRDGWSSASGSLTRR